MSASNAVVPFEQLHTMAAAFAKSGMFGAKNQEQALSLLLLAQAEGVHPAIAMRDFDIINGRPAKKAEAMQRAFLAAGGKIEWHKYDDTGADATFSHPAGGTLRVSWDAERAKRAGIGNKDMYGKYGRQMFGSRVISEGVRKVYPAATSGLYVPEEVRHFEAPKEKNMGEAEVVHDGSPAPQETPIAASAPSSLASGAAPVGAAFITETQAGALRAAMKDCDSYAEEKFLAIAKIKRLEDLPAHDYDEAVLWVGNRKKKLAAAK